MPLQEREKRGLCCLQAMAPLSAGPASPAGIEGGRRGGSH